MKESAPINKKAELKSRAAIVLSNDKDLLESFIRAINEASNHEIDENYDKLIKNPNDLRRLAINAYQLQSLESLKESMWELNDTLREIELKHIEPAKRKQDNNTSLENVW